MNAPERIYTAETLGGIIAAEGEPPAWLDPPRYIRADLFAALEAEKAKAEAERDALRVVQNLHSRRKLEARADKAEALLAEAVGALREADRFMAYFSGETGGSFAGPGTPVTCLSKIRATLAKIKEAKDNG